MNKPNDKTAKPAYVSYKSLTTYLDGIRELGHAPDVIDRGTMKNFSGATQNELLPALKFLGLADDKSAPTAVLTEYALADDEARKPILAVILREAYSFMFKHPTFNIERATENQIADLFRDQGLNGSTNSRAIAFFLAAAKEAGIKVSPYVKAPTIVRNGPAKSRKAKPAAAQTPAPAADPNPDGGAERNPPGMHQFEIPLPMKGAVRVIVPNDIDGEDWELINTMFAAYMKRWKGFMVAQQAATKPLKETGLE